MLQLLCMVWCDVMYWKCWLMSSVGICGPSYYALNFSKKSETSIQCYNWTVPGWKKKTWVFLSHEIKLHVVNVNKFCFPCVIFPRERKVLAATINFLIQIQTFFGSTMSADKEIKTQSKFNGTDFNCWLPTTTANCKPFRFKTCSKSRFPTWCQTNSKKALNFTD